MVSEALSILREVGCPGAMEREEIPLAKARQNYNEAVAYCRTRIGVKEWSVWRGVMMSADGLASALAEQGLADQIETGRLSRKPDLRHYASRQSALYPLSLRSAEDRRPHTMVTAPTGAGKTDFLLRRCRGRVFYTLPFQASINAMYDRIWIDLAGTEAEIRLLHACSALRFEKGAVEERVLRVMREILQNVQSVADYRSKRAPRQTMTDFLPKYGRSNFPSYHAIY